MCVNCLLQEYTARQLLGLVNCMSHLSKRYRYRIQQQLQEQMAQSMIGSSAGGGSVSVAGPNMQPASVASALLSSISPERFWPAAAPPAATQAAHVGNHAVPSPAHSAF